MTSIHRLPGAFDHCLHPADGIQGGYGSQSLCNQSWRRGSDNSIVGGSISRDACAQDLLWNLSSAFADLPEVDRRAFENDVAYSFGLGSQDLSSFVHPTVTGRTQEQVPSTDHRRRSTTLSATANAPKLEPTQPWYLSQQETLPEDAWLRNGRLKSRYVSDISSRQAFDPYSSAALASGHSYTSNVLPDRCFDQEGNLRPGFAEAIGNRGA
ncbi:hypothetical protein BD324DRAFT_25775 [Kockovaella imperatae]|uniref:Uncharacterized protein n=1 Tax=Kockovaella imperatae TaxID=4999 RepID=A0A1Y1US67_9TREE|nr:hypothetical protein BD324DRAFT_25775 [Kockovaella imperatae]ORX40871.1 hypothetical protein BD324DRAFT_25775 [Kockovaella imperatae]